MIKNYFKAGVWYFADNIVNVIYMLFSSVLVARIYGPGFLGKLSFVQAISTILMMLPVMGLDQVLLKRIINEKKNRDEIICNTLVMQMTGWVVYVAIIYIYFDFFSQIKNYINIMLSIVFTTLLTRLSVFQFAFQATYQIGYIFIANILSRAGSLFFIFIVTSNELSESITVYYFVVQTFLFCTIITYFFIKSDKFVFCINWTVVKSLINESWPLMFSTFVVSIYMQTDVLMIERYMTLHDVGIYSAVMKLIIPLGFIGGVISNVMFPLLVKNYSSNIYEYKRNLILSLRVCYLLSILTSVIIMFLSEELVIFIYGPSYIESSNVLRLMSVIIVFLIPASMLTKILLLEGYAKIELLKTSVAAVLNVALNMCLIPKYGLYGAASASITAYVVSDLIMYGLIDKTRVLFFKIIFSMVLCFNPVYWISQLKRI